MFKRCSKCKVSKPLTDFHKGKKYEDGRQHRCKDCAKQFTQPATISWRKNNPESLKQSTQRTKIRLKYGLTIQETLNILDLQGGKCAVCSKEISFDAKEKANIPHVDHDHKTGIVRGLLCLTCNTGLGMFGDSEDLLEAAKIYLISARHRERSSEEAPHSGDAMIRSHENNNHEKLAEMTNSTIH